MPISSEASVTADHRYGSNRNNAYPLPGYMNRLRTFEEAFDCSNAGNQPAPDLTPPCDVQAPFRFRGKATQFPRLRPDR